MSRKRSTRMEHAREVWDVPRSYLRRRRGRRCCFPGGATIDNREQTRLRRKSVPARRCGCRGILLAGASLIDELQMAQEGCTIERTGDPSVSSSRNGCVAGRRGCVARAIRRELMTLQLGIISRLSRSNGRTVERRQGSLSTPDA